MKKTLLFLSFVLVSTNCFAAATGPIASDRWGKGSVGFEYNTITNRDMDASNKQQLDDYEIDSSDQFYGVGSYRVYHDKKTQVNVYAKLGTADLETTALVISNNQIERINYDFGFLWGIGANYVYDWSERVDFVLDAQYIDFESEIESVDFNGEQGSGISGAPDARLKEFQIAALIRTPLELELDRRPVKLVPYYGVAFSWLDMDTGRITYTTTGAGTRSTDTSADEDENVGLVLGTEVYAYNDALRLKVDGRLISETSIAISGEYLY